MEKTRFTGSERLRLTFKDDGPSTSATDFWNEIYLHDYIKRKTEQQASGVDFKHQSVIILL